MTDYAAMSERGLAAARETNTRFRLRVVVEHRTVTRPGQRWVPGVPPFPAHWADDHDRPVVTVAAVGDCGHVVAESAPGQELPPSRSVGRRVRCRRCPADPAAPLREDHCEYEIVTTAGERPCRTRGRYVDEGGWGRLCRRHHDHLLREGYLDKPLPGLGV